MIFKIISVVLLVFLFLIYPCYASDLILVDTSPNSLDLTRQVDLVCKFYGLTVERLFVGEDRNNYQVIDSIKHNESKAVILTSNALLYIKARDVLSTFSEQQEKSMIFLITGIVPSTDSKLLKEWSGGAVVDCKSSADIPSKGLCKVTGLRNITSELFGKYITFTCKRICHLLLENTKASQPILEITAMNDGLLPVFVKTEVNGQDLFFQTEMCAYDSPKESIWQYQSHHFFEIAPLMIFIRYAYGDRCWHSAKNYANLIIDDPWLIEPYGQLNYKGLYEEMQNAHFHTTIAFIPWNYDRSKPDVVSLFRNYPERLSICIHGNNHDHYEFYKYETGPGDPWPAKPLNTQEADIKQALARMEKFRSMTGISYDKVMVFPHSIAPAKTLGLLKKYNFLATVNAENVPLGSYEPKDSSFLLRPVTLNFENFPSLKRYSPNRTQAEIAIDLFLDNPIIFYAHHDFFQNGIDAFDKTANMVNKIQPDIIWQSLGYIAQHLYLEKLRDDGNYDVKTFSSNFIIENVHHNDLVYFVRKEEDFSIPIKQVTIDSQPFSYKKNGNNLILEVFVPAGESRNVVIESENSLDISSIDVSKNDQRVNRLRKLSDFRDMTLSKNFVGRIFTHFYYDTGIYKLGLVRSVILLLIFIIFATLGTWYFIRIVRKRRSKF